MKDQKQHWNEAHASANLRPYADKQTSFAELTASYLSPRSRILELGCGEGMDAVYLARMGHSVTATDFSDVLIEEKKSGVVEGVCYEQLDISKPFPYERQSFDAVYARLALHYFPNDITHNVFDEIGRVLDENGILCFMCKSVDDRLYGKGVEIEPDMFELDGHVRHFFSEVYARQLLHNKFTILAIDLGKEEMYGKVSGFVKVVAKKV